MTTTPTPEAKTPASQLSPALCATFVIIVRDGKTVAIGESGEVLAMWERELTPDERELTPDERESMRINPFQIFEQPSPARSDKKCDGTIRFQIYELDGVIADVEQGRGFDSVCLDTIKRVRSILASQATPAGQAQERAPSSETIDHDAFWVLVAHCRDAKPGKDYCAKSAALVAYLNQWAAALARRATAGTTARCPHCDGTGDVHDQTGEWRGACTCVAGTTAAPAECGNCFEGKSDMGHICRVCNGSGRATAGNAAPTELSTLQRYFNSEFGVEKFSRVQHKNMPDVPTYFLAADVEKLLASNTAPEPVGCIKCPRDPNKRCDYCGYDFASQTPICPDCGTHEVSIEHTCHNSACTGYARATTICEGWHVRNPDRGS